MNLYIVIVRANHLHNKNELNNKEKKKKSEEEQNKQYLSIR